jgi:hypothetical protein
VQLKGTHNHRWYTVVPIDMLVCVEQWNLSLLTSVIAFVYLRN